MGSLPKSLEYLSQCGFVKGVVKKNVISDISFLPLGTAFLDNVRSEWFKYKSDLNSYPAVGAEEDSDDRSDKFAFLQKQALRKNLLHVKETFQNELPLVIKSEGAFKGFKKAEGENTIHIDIPRGTLLARNYFFSPSVAQEKFYNIQRERKIFWMKYSSNPSRYRLSDMITNERGSYKLQSLKIKSNLGFDEIDMESIHLVPIAAMELKNEKDFAMRDAMLGRDVIPTCIRTEFKLEAAACALLLDSMESNKKDTLALNRKLAPYQCGVFCYFKDNATYSDLSDLSTHLCNVVRKIGISVLNLKKCHTNDWNTVTKEINQMDKIGVPYCIILESDTLRTGLMKMRSRDTTLSETIHITDVSHYFQKIFKV